jgi:hypothetical protein
MTGMDTSRPTVNKILNHAECDVTATTTTPTTRKRTALEDLEPTAEAHPERAAEEGSDTRSLGR